MLLIRAFCHSPEKSHDVELRPPDVSIIQWEQCPKTEFQFRCPTCLFVNLQPLTKEDTDKLRKDGVLTQYITSNQIEVVHVNPSQQSNIS